MPTMEQVAVAWDERVLAAHSLPHFMQSTTWASTRDAGPWQATRRDLGVADEFPVLVFEREAEGFGRPDLPTQFLIQPTPALNHLSHRWF